MFPLVLSPRRHPALTSCLASGVPATAGSEHFTVYCLAPAEHTGEPRPELVVVHSFSPDQVDNNLGYYVVNELLPLLMATGGRTPPGARADDPFVTSEQAIFEHCVGAIVRSVDGNEHRAWDRFYGNSLAALEQALVEPGPAADFITPFGMIYRRLMALVAGPTLLDAGTCFGFLPLLLARQSRAASPDHPQLLGEPLAKITGCDLDSVLMGFATAYAGRRHHRGVQFVHADILADEFQQLGRFATVTAVHVIEHLDRDQTLIALTNLWQVTARRLIITVPLEEIPDPRFGHRQVFDESSLLALGRELGGRQRYFELHGGWLVVDRV